jgi:hypothetical protein
MRARLNTWWGDEGICQVLSGVPLGCAEVTDRSMNEQELESGG